MTGNENFREAERLVGIALTTDADGVLLFSYEQRDTLLKAALVRANLAQAVSASNLLARIEELGSVMREASGLNDPLPDPPANHPVRFAPVTGPQPQLTEVAEVPA